MTFQGIYIHKRWNTNDWEIFLKIFNILNISRIKIRNLFDISPHPNQNAWMRKKLPWMLKCWWGYGNKKNTYPWQMRVEIVATTMNSAWRLLKKPNVVLLHYPHLPPLGIYRKYFISYSDHCCFSHNSPEMAHQHI